MALHTAAAGTGLMTQAESATLYELRNICTPFWLRLELKEWQSPSVTDITLSRALNLHISYLELLSKPSISSLLTPFQFHFFSSLSLRY